MNCKFIYWKDILFREEKGKKDNYDRHKIS
jgi:hypothetical protein